MNKPSSPPLPPLETLAQGWAFHALGQHMRYGEWRESRPTQGFALIHAGRGETIERYSATAAELQSRGFRVFALEARTTGDRSDVADFKVYLDDIEEFHTQIWQPHATQGMRIAIGHSMGGHLMLRHALNHQADFDALMVTAPLLQLPNKGVPRALVRPITCFMSLVAPHAYALGQKPYERIQFAGNAYTADERLFDQWQDFLARHPQHQMGGATWQWVAAAQKSCDALAKALPTLRLPLLACVTPQDRVVDGEAQMNLNTPHKVVLPHAGHEVLQEVRAIRAQIWQGFDAFVRHVQPAATL